MFTKRKSRLISKTKYCSFLQSASSNQSWISFSYLVYGINSELEQTLKEGYKVAIIDTPVLSFFMMIRFNAQTDQVTRFLNYGSKRVPTRT